MSEIVKPEDIKISTEGAIDVVRTTYQLMRDPKTLPEAMPGLKLIAGIYETRLIGDLTDDEIIALRGPSRS